MYKNRQNGFTILELLIVIAIIGITSAIVLASLNTARAKARDSMKVSQFVELRNALFLYHADVGRYPYNWNTYNETAIETRTTPNQSGAACDRELPGIPGGGVPTPGCPTCSHVTLLNPEAFALSMQELVDAGYLSQVPRSEPGSPGICYYQNANEVLLVTVLEESEPSATGAPGTFRYNYGYDNWCDTDPINRSHCFRFEK
jgi:prepilin-type N-terminal cleavage/methylation domain-containing protein